MKANRIRTAEIILLLSSMSIIMASCGGGASQPVSYTEERAAASEEFAALDTAVVSEPPALEGGFKSVAYEDIDERVAVAAQPAPPGASGGPSMNDYYVPSKAFDGNYKSWWVGDAPPQKWNLYYGFTRSYHFDTVYMNFYNNDYVPPHIAVYASDDGVNWRNIANVAQSGYRAIIPVNADARYLKFFMNGRPKSGYPLIREIAWLPFVEKPGAFALPGVNDAYYFPSNAFDGDQNTWWAGEAGAPSWDVYYRNTSSRPVSMFTAHLFNINYYTDKMTLYISGDGLNWTRVGELGPGPNETTFKASIYVGRPVAYMKLHIEGASPSKFPLIKDISWDFETGPVSGDSFSSYYKAANAFDNQPNTWWVGRSGAGAWDVFYAFAQPVAVGALRLQFYAATHAPSSTEVLTSNDGVNWTSAGAVVSNDAAPLPVNRTARFLRFSMRGNPAVGYPLVKDISWN